MVDIYYTMGGKGVCGLLWLPILDYSLVTTSNPSYKLGIIGLAQIRLPLSPECRFHAF